MVAPIDTVIEIATAREILEIGIGEEGDTEAALAATAEIVAIATEVVTVNVVGATATEREENATLRPVVAADPETETETETGREVADEASTATETGIERESGSGVEAGMTRALSLVEKVGVEEEVVVVVVVAVVAAVERSVFLIE